MKVTHTKRSSKTLPLRIGLLFLPLLLLFALVFAASALATTAGPAWEVSPIAAPTNFTPAQNATCLAAGQRNIFRERECDHFSATVTNAGTAPTTGASVTITDALPAGVTVESIELEYVGINAVYFKTHPHGHGDGQALAEQFCHSAASVVTCLAPGSLKPADALRFTVYVTVDLPEPPSAAITNTVTVEGGGAAAITHSVSNTIDGSSAVFGLSSLSAPLSNLQGGVGTQAGAHPYELPLNISLNSVVRHGPEGFLVSTSPQDLRDVIVDLPPGVSGSALAAPACTLQQLSAPGPRERGFSNCPVSSIVGYIETHAEAVVSVDSPIYNLVPEKGTAAEFGFVDIQGDTHVIDVGVAPTPEGYVLRSTTREITQITLDEIIADLYGDPAARDKTKQPDVPLFTNPADCSNEPLMTTVYLDSWQNPGTYNADGTPDLEGDPGAWVKGETESAPAVSGCEALAELFKTELVAHTEAETKGEATAADSPTGLDVSLKVAQEKEREETGGEALATPPLKEAVVTLPAGMSVNASSANGLAACSESEIGWQGKSQVASGEYENFNAFNPERSDQNPNPETTCPPASKLGTVEVESPALAGEVCKGEARSLSECAKEEEPAGSGVFPEREKTPLQGSIYLATQSENPFGSLLAGYIVIDDERTGLIVKVPAKIELGGGEGNNPALPALQPGQLRTVVKDSPQFPFSALRVHIAGGADAPLRSPMGCGSYALSSVLTPWSHEPANGEVGTPDGEPSSSVSVGAGCGGGFAPGFSAGMSSTSQAGAYSPFSLDLTRDDGTQELKALNVTLPPGLIGKIAGIPLCSEADIQQAESRTNAGEGKLEQSDPSCPEASKVGTVTVGAGAGPDPFYATGQVYLAGPYNGAPFDLVVITPAVAGPFDLGTVVVRNALYINPSNVQVSSKSSPLPRELKGIPIDIRSIVLNMNRADFTFNPTSCNAMAVTAEAVSVSGQTAALSSPFKAQNCAGLPFHPVLTATTTGNASRSEGASLKVNITAKSGEANIAKTDLTIPLQLPARLKTLQKACTEAQFNTNPADCPEDSVIGMATVHTQVLNVPLTGPMYIVSHGGAAFPDVEIVLQGEGVEIVLDGKTDIKKGITYSNFEAVDDAPFTSFEANLGEGPHSILTAHLPHEFYDLCGQKLTIPTRIVGQNGALIEQNTKVAVSGCAKVKALTKAQLLSKALAECHKKYKAKSKKAKRQKCEKAARKKYGAKVKQKTKQAKKGRK
jgi:hypothetical protein